MSTLTTSTMDELALAVKRIVTIWVAVCLLLFGLGLATRFLIEDAIEVVASFIRKVFHYPTNSTLAPTSVTEHKPAPKMESAPDSEPETNTEPTTTTVEPTPEIASEPSPEIASKPSLELASEPSPELASEPSPEIASEPTPEVESKLTFTSAEELASLKVAELRKLARSLKIKGVSNLRKAELVKLLEASLLRG